VSKRSDGDHTPLTLEVGTVDVEERARTLRDALLDLPEDVSEVLVDLAGTDLLDGGTLAVLLSAAHEFGAERSIAVAAPPRISESLEEWRVDALVPVYATEDQEDGAR
jgi:hypothetical protein